MLRFGQGFHACRFVISCIRSASAVERRAVMLFVGDSLLLAARNRAGGGLTVELGSQRLMSRTCIGA
jgi:hypothetical protein